MSGSAPFVPMLVTATGVGGALVAFRLRRPFAYAAAKTAASLGFVGTALAAGALDHAWSRLALVALVLSAAGDVALALRAANGFIAGLVLFALAHTVYTAAFLVYGSAAATTAILGLLAALSAWSVWVAFRERLPARMRVPAAVYLGVLSAMVASGTAAGITHRSWLLVCGVALVAGSDIAVGRERFGTSMFANKLIGLPAYYLGQTLIALSLRG